MTLKLEHRQNSDLHLGLKPTLPSFRTVDCFASRLPQDQWNLSQCIRADFPRDHEYFPRVDIDEECFFQKTLWAELRGKSLAEWLDLHRTCHTSRLCYGSGTASGRAKTNNDADHTVKEQERRSLEKLLLVIEDSLCSNLHHQLSPNALNEVKNRLNQAQAQNEAHGPKPPSKNEVHIATIFQKVMANWIIEAQQQRNNEYLDLVASPAPPMLTRIKRVPRSKVTDSGPSSWQPTRREHKLQQRRVEDQRTRKKRSKNPHLSSHLPSPASSSDESGSFSL